MAGKGLCVNDLVEHCGLDDAYLDTEITRDNFQKISPYLSIWKLLAPTLNISETEVKDIEDNSRSAEEKRLSFLQKWKQKMSMKATYRALVESLLEIKRGEDARGVCQVLKATSASILPEILVIPRLETGSLKQQIMRLESNFKCLVDSVEESFVKRHVLLKRIQNSVKHIHISLKLELGERFEEQASKILKTKSVEELFILLSHFWNYLNPGLLEYLVGQFGSKQDMVSLQTYLKDLKKFRSSIKLGEFIHAKYTRFNAKSCYCQKIVTIMGNDWEEKTLQEAEEYKKELANELQLQQFLAIFDVKLSCIAIIFYLPHQIKVDIVKLEQFFKRNKVIKVFRDDDCLFDWTKQVNAKIEEDEATHNVKTKSSNTGKHTSKELEDNSSDNDLFHDAPIKVYDDTKEEKMSDTTTQIQNIEVMGTIGQVYISDSRGGKRGKCNSCGGCTAFKPQPDGLTCRMCGHPPGKHDVIGGTERQDQKPVSVAGVVSNLSLSDGDSDGGATAKFPQCSSPGCSNGVYFDLNLGKYCEHHRDLEQADDNSASDLDSSGDADISNGSMTCAIEDCPKPRHVDSNGTVHECCGYTHAMELARRRILKNDEVLSEDEKCIYPNCNRRRYSEPESDITHEFCGRRHAQLYCGQVMLEPSKLGICSLPGCSKFKYQDPSNGRIHDFCGRTHAHSGVAADRIKIAPATSEEYTIVTQTFISQWASKKGACPSIDYIFSVSNTKLKQIWEAYRKGLPDPTIEKHFHGTKLECDITSTRSLCSSVECGICGIANIGFDRRCIKKNISFQRFGHGFYLAPQSSKCHDYTQGKSGYRAMLLFDVCPGKKHLVQNDDETFTAPPKGYHCVYGLAGKNLNYDEMVIYNPDGALPKYIIVYKKDGEKKIAA